MQALKLDKYKHAWELTFTVLLPGFNSINVNGIKGWGGEELAMTKCRHLIDKLMLHLNNLN
jgi:hypothetical protein